MPATATTAQETAATEVGAAAARVMRLRELSEGDPAAARDDAWAWFVEAGKRIQTSRRAALEELGELFRTGRPSREIDGETRGTLVGFTVTPALDRTLAMLSTGWLPWAGKRFNSASSTGDNLLLRSARVPSKVMWPTYRMRDAGSRLAGFDFETRVERGALDTDRDVLVIDYKNIDSNPFLIRKIRDELVEVVPGAHLGKMLWRHGSGERHSLLAYFALRSPAAG